MINTLDTNENNVFYLFPLSKIRHYCDHSLSFIMAVPSENPVVSANLPLILNRSPGDSSAEALRMALLGVASIHQSFLLARGGSTQYGADEMLQLSHSYRMSSKQLLAKACTTVEGVQSDASLAASIAIALMDVSLLALSDVSLLRSGLSNHVNPDIFWRSELVEKYDLGENSGGCSWRS